MQPEWEKGSSIFIGNSSLLNYSDGHHNSLTEETNFSLCCLFLDRRLHNNEFCAIILMVQTSLLT